ncbi:hypothetical protein CH352_02460 [Leptospira hartskeerlii]|uniref:DUF6603 domain-containing protein n=1 Tax=Leptospira hartskeerlii TaxID=2023177 RepID=A0A2M9XDA7_9LEPT|nr:hypothetical protein CH357_08515 [Leptospira hartskeerlii]PJZ35492.1 hypothetical protein CH352_02460 [Leptospira hartskeerlii]
MDLVLDKTTLQEDYLTDQLFTILKTDSFKIGQPQKSTQDGNGNFSISGKTNLLQFEDIQVTITFFLSWETGSSDKKRLECLIVPSNFPDHWNITKVYQNLPGYEDSAPDKISLGRQESFFKEIDIDKIDVRYSSFDFFEASEAQKHNEITYRTSSLLENTNLPLDIAGQELKAGLNFTGNIAPQGDFWTTLSFIPNLPSSLPIFACIGPEYIPEHEAPETDVPIIRDGVADIGYHFDEGISFSVGSIQISLKTLNIRTGLSIISGVDPGFYLDVQIGDLELVVFAGIGSKNLTITGYFDSGLITVQKLIAALSLGNLNLPSDFSALGDISLKEINFSLSLSSNAGINSLGFTLTTSSPWQLLEGKVSILPQLIYKKQYANSVNPETTSLRVVGVWDLNGTDLITTLDPDPGDISIFLAPNQKLEIGSFLEELLSVNHMPEIEIVDFELDGNYKTKTFGLILDIGSDWEINISGKSMLTVTGMHIELQKEEKNTTAVLSGSFLIGDTSAIITVDIQKELSIKTFFSSINVGNLIDQFLHGIDLPLEFPDFTVENLAISVTPKTGEFDIQGSSSDTIPFFEGLGLQINFFHVSRTLVDPQQKRYSKQSTIHITFDVGGVQLTLAADKKVSDLPQGSTNSDSLQGWVFQLAQGASPIPFGKLIENLGEWIGLEMPIWLGELTIHDLYMEFNVGSPNKCMVISGTVKDGEKQLGKISLLAQKLDPADTYGKTPTNASSEGSNSSKAHWDHIVCLEIDVDIDLKDLPVAGPQLSAVGDMKLHSINCTIASREFKGVELETLLQKLPQSALSPASSTSVESGSSFSVKLQLAGSNVALSVPIESKTQSQEQFPGAYIPPDPITQQTPVDKTKWFPVHLNFKAFNLDRIGVRFQNSRVGLLIDAFIDLGGIKIGLAGLGLNTPFTDFSPTFELSGLSVEYNNPPVTIGGGFLRSGEVYQGLARLSLTSFDMTAVGAYGTIDGHPSFFIFAILKFPLTEPSLFRLTGAAAGMGYNSKLKIPQLERIRDFSLINAALPQQTMFSNTSDPVMVMREMSADIVPELGAKWFAAGITFNSFELINSLALLIIDMDREGLEANILGFSRMSVPSQIPNPIAYAEMVLFASYSEAKGYLKVCGGLTKASYLFAPINRLSGYFAYCKWFAGENEGDFVYSLGGYHPKFQAPAHYPNLSRIGFNWRLSSNLSISGSMYFAVVPHALMAGGSFNAIWESGGIDAWFTAEIDFLMQWKPFYYEASVSISIGVSLTISILFAHIRISVSVGVGVDFHGPNFGGTARVHLYVCSFSIHFGDSSPQRIPLTWDQFKQSFLPAPLVGQKDNYLSIRVSQGLLVDLSDKNDTFDWILSSEHAELMIHTVIPLKYVQFNNETFARKDDSWSMDFGVNPSAYNPQHFQTKISITLSKHGDSTLDDNFLIDPIISGQPGALWLEDQGMNGPRTVPKALVGFALRPILPEAKETPWSPISLLLFEQNNLNIIFYSDATAPASDAFETNISEENLTYNRSGKEIINRNLILQDIEATEIQAYRKNILQDLKLFGLDLDDQVDLKIFSTETVLDDWPVVTLLGE